MSEDLCTAPLLNQRLGAAGLLQLSSSHYQHRAQSSSPHPGMWVLVMEGAVIGHDAVPCGLQLGVKHLELWWHHSGRGCIPAWLCCSDIWALAFAGHFPPKTNPQISPWIYPAAMGRVLFLPSKALPQGLWPRGLFAASSDYRNFRLLVHYKTNRHSLHLVFIRRLDKAWGMQMPCDEEKKIPGLWRCESWQIRWHYGIILDLFANWGTTAVKHVSILGAEE